MCSNFVDTFSVKISQDLGVLIPHPRTSESWQKGFRKKSWPLLLLHVVQGASRNPTKAALDATAEVFSDENSTASAAAQKYAPHSLRKNGLTPLRSPHARHKCD
jgi:hypothetical protein